MSESDDSDILADIKALDNALMLDNANNKTNSSWHDLHDDSSSSSMDESDDSYSDDQFCNQWCQDTETINAYEINRKLTKGLMLVKKKVNTMLQRCEEKIEELNEEIETSKDGSMLHTRRKYSIAGTPYFKDKAGFGAGKNADTKLKETRKELSVLHMQKSCRWSGKDRTMLLNAIYDEVLNSISISRPNVEINQLSDERTTNQTEDPNETTNGEPSKSSNIMDSSAQIQTVVPINFNEILRTMDEKQIDWMKIAAQHFPNKHSLGECRSMWNVYLHPDFNKGDWTNVEDKKLVQYAKQCSYQDWDNITKKLGTKRSSYQCFIRYNTIQSLPVVGRTWTKLEDKHLQLVLSKLQIGNYIPWAEVAIYMNNRTKQQVYTRWMYRTAPHLTKGRFNYMETKTLLEAIKQYGTDFSKISRYVMPHRTTVQLSNHYQSIHQNKSNKWTYEDDVKLLRLHKKHGNNWVKIANNFTLKTRTQVRHRYRALQKYINKGYKIVSIPRSKYSASLDGKKISESLSAKNSQSIHRQISLLNSNISNDTIQARLFENLNFPLMMASTSSQEVYDFKQLVYNTKELYDILKLLDVKFDVPNLFLDYVHLSMKEKQLFASLKKYVDLHQHVGDEKHNEVIEKFRLQMFGSETQNVISHYIPPLPFNGYVKRKRKYKTNSINYDSDYSEKFLVDVSTDRIIPCYDNHLFVNVDEEIQFQKLSQLLINDNYSCNRQNVNSLASLDYNSSLNERKTPLRAKIPNTVIKLKGRATERVASCKTQKTTDVNKDDEEMEMLDDAITPSRETLLGLKNLIFWKMLYEYENNPSYSNSKNVTQQCKKISNNPEYEKAYQRLKTRVMRLFKLPLALSRVLVEVPEQDALFITEEQKEKSKKKWSEKQTEKNRQTIFANNSFSQKTT